jgi:hypothetical protein
MKTRAGLSESLEEYAARLGVSRNQARASWRLQGLRFLFPSLQSCAWEEIVKFVLPNGCGPAYAVVAPQISVLTPGYECEIDNG